MSGYERDFPKSARSHPNTPPGRDPAFGSFIPFISFIHEKFPRIAEAVADNWYLPAHVR